MKWMLEGIGVGNKCCEPSTPKMWFGNTKSPLVGVLFSIPLDKIFVANQRVPFDLDVFGGAEGRI